MMKLMNDKTISLKISSELKEEVEKKAEKMGITFSEAIRNSLSNTYAPSLEGKEVRVVKGLDKKTKKAS